MQFIEIMRKIRSRLATLAVPDSDLQAFNKSLGSIESSGKAALRNVSKSEIFHLELARFFERLDEYFKFPPFSRCKAFISQLLGSFSAVLQKLAIRIASSRQKVLPLYTDLKKSVIVLQTFLDNVRSPPELLDWARECREFESHLSSRFSLLLDLIRSERPRILADFQRLRECAEIPTSSDPTAASFISKLPHYVTSISDLIPPAGQADSVRLVNLAKSGPTIAVHPPLPRRSTPPKRTQTDLLNPDHVSVPRARDSGRLDEGSNDAPKTIVVPRPSLTSDPSSSIPMPVPDYSGLHSEVASLRAELTRLEAFDLTPAEIEGGMIVAREFLKIERDRLAILEAELGRTRQINADVQVTESSTVEFDTLQLTKEINELTDELNRRKIQVEALKREREQRLDDAEEMNAEERAVVNQLLWEDTRQMTRMIADLSARIENAEKNEPDMNVDFLRERSENLQKLRRRVARLEKSASGGSELAGRISTARETVVKHQQTLDALLVQIDQLSDENGKLEIKREDFDVCEALKTASREIQQRYARVKEEIVPSLTAKERFAVEMRLDEIQDEYTTVMLKLERLKDTTAQDNLRNARKYRNRARQTLAKTLDQANMVITESLEREAKVIESEQELRQLARSHGKIDEKSVMKLSELILERLKCIEVLALINNQTQEFAAELAGNETGRADDGSDPAGCVKRIEDLKDAVAGILKSRGSRAEQRLRIYNLQKELERLQSQP
jgi:hypothetical protein